MMDINSTQCTRTLRRYPRFYVRCKLCRDTRVSNFNLIIWWPILYIGDDGGFLLYMRTKILDKMFERNSSFHMK